jgi:sterol desaturase/sphingolipid hydroxylase (fatty acid hydroxylase superfamily)
LATTDRSHATRTQTPRILKAMTKTAVILTSLLVFGCLEQLHPFTQFRSTPWRRMVPNFSLGILNTIVTQLTTLALLTWLWQNPLHHYAAPVWVTFLSLDAYMYGWHRMMHRYAWGWRLHRLHHSDRELNISTTYRFHTLEVVLSQLPKLLLIALLGMQPQDVLIYECCFALSLVFHHSNWRLSPHVDRLLSYLIVTPNLHRRHHSPKAEDQQHNFSSLMSLWDRWFGTIY